MKVTRQFTPRDAANATKWLNRTAQGFSPGLAGRASALKVAPDRCESRIGCGALIDWY
jgi:hypothetical protein